MHACAHDGHMAMLLVAAKILSQQKEKLKGNIKFVFQPNEENAGARLMVEEGVLENPKVDACVNWNRRAWRGLSAIVPLMPSGENTGACHLTWTDRKYQENDAIILELSGCYRRYHSPMARTIFLGDNPPQELQRMADIVAEGVNTTLEFIKPGVTCEEIEATWAGVLKNTA